MLDNILNTVRQGVEKVQRRGEEVTQVARLRVEVFQLGRELDGHYARLGRAYHSGAAADLLHGIREDIRRVEADIESREHLIAELGEAGDDAPEAASTDLAPTPADSARARLSQNLAAERQGQQPGTAAPADQPRGEPVRPTAEQDVPSSTASQPSASNRPAFVDEANDQTKG